MRKLILNLHLVGALIGGIFLIILGGTGGILVFQNELDRALNPNLFNLADSGPIVPLDAVQQAVAQHDPKLKVYRIILPESESRPYIARAGATQVFVNSHTGAIIGTRQSPTLLETIRQLHTGLLLGKPGHIIVQVATWLSLFLILSGLYLWWPLRRTGKSRGLSFYLHLTFGIYFAAFLLALTISGLVIAYDEVVGGFVNSATHSTPPKWNMDSAVVENAKPVPAADAIRAASERLPEAKPFAINFPGNTKGSYHVAMKYPDDSDDEGASWVLVDQYSGAVLYTHDSREASTGNRIMNSNGMVHTGQIFGLPSKVIMSISSFFLVLQTITGYVIWWRKLTQRAPQGA